MGIFIRRFEGGKGDYAEEREALLVNVDIDDAAASIKRRRGQ